MKLLKILVLALGLSAVSSQAQDLVVEDLPVATITEGFFVTVPEVPMVSDYYVDISHMDFVDEEDAKKKLATFVTGNIVTPILNYEENYFILHVHMEYMGGDYDVAKLQHYLNTLTKPTE